jgi:hypothetical protein
VNARPALPPPPIGGVGSLTRRAAATRLPPPLRSLRSLRCGSAVRGAGAPLGLPASERQGGAQRQQPERRHEARPMHVEHTGGVPYNHSHIVVKSSSDWLRSRPTKVSSAQPTQTKVNQSSSALQSSRGVDGSAMPTPPRCGPLTAALRGKRSRGPLVDERVTVRPVRCRPRRPGYGSYRRTAVAISAVSPPGYHRSAVHALRRLPRSRSTTGISQCAIAQCPRLQSRASAPPPRTDSRPHDRRHARCAPAAVHSDDRRSGGGGRRPGSAAVAVRRYALDSAPSGAGRSAGGGPCPAFGAALPLGAD